MERDKNRCPIWGTPTEGKVEEGQIYFKGRDVLSVNSLRAGGRYGITEEAWYVWEDYLDDARFKGRLTTWLVEQRQMGIAVPIITEKILENVKSRPMLGVDEKIDRLLLFFYELSGQVPWKEFSLFAQSDFNIVIPEDDPREYQKISYLISSKIELLTENTVESDPYGRVDIDEEQRKHGINYVDNEVFDFINMAEKQELFETRGDSVFTYVKFTAEGIRRLEKVLYQPNTASPQAFVAMWFDTSMDSAYWEGIHVAIKELGYEPRRIDKKEYNGKIDDEIIAEIKRSKFLIADFSQGEDGARGGVYYEAGFAHALGIPVIFTCRKGDVKKLHFDTRQFNHIVWENEEDLKEQLKNRIGATIGDGPLKI